MGLRKLVAGNWKMHGLSADLVEIEAIASGALEFPDVDVALCVPAILIERAARVAPGFSIGGQDVHQAGEGAHTGGISARMLLDAGAKLTIVGHSEQREALRETDADVKAKAETAIECGLGVILCVGEALQIREQGAAVATVMEQLDGSLPERMSAQPELAIAYEPIWAIGTGKVPSDDEIAEMHSAIRARLAVHYGSDGEHVRILYGGSVKSSNAGEIFSVSNVNGALVGGASLKAADFLPVIAAAAAS